MIHYYNIIAGKVQVWRERETVNEQNAVKS